MPPARWHTPPASVGPLEPDDFGFDYYSTERHDPAFVGVIEECIRTGKYPDGHDLDIDLRVDEVSGPYFIREYDGSESVLEMSDIDWR